MASRRGPPGGPGTAGAGVRARCLACRVTSSQAQRRSPRQSPAVTVSPSPQPYGAPREKLGLPTMPAAGSASYPEHRCTRLRCMSVRTPPTLLAVAGAFLALTTLPAISAGSAGPPSTPLGALALHEVTRANDRDLPTTAQAVLTTRSQAEQAAGEGVPDPQPVYLVQIPGSFVLSGASRPAGVPPLGGTYLTFTVDPTLNSVLDLGLSDRPLDLAQLGPVIVLQL